MNYVVEYFCFNFKNFFLGGIDNYVKGIVNVNIKSLF